MTSVDYETLYKKLKQEYEENKEINDEINKEYESTIQMITKTAEDLKKEKEQLQKKLNEAIIGQRNLQNELNTFKARNSDKMKDIEMLNNKNNRFIEKFKLKELLII